MKFQRAARLAQLVMAGFAQGIHEVHAIWPELIRFPRAGAENRDEFWT
jgi:hypothetical protein